MHKNLRKKLWNTEETFRLVNSHVGLRLAKFGLLRSLLLETNHVTPN